MKIKKTIFFVRHGHVRNPGRIFYGRLPGFHLSTQGINQVQLVSKALSHEKIDAIYSSPLARASETADIIHNEQPNCELFESDLLNEVYSPYDGMNLDYLEKNNWDVYKNNIPHYEQPKDVLERTRKFVSMVWNSNTLNKVIAVTHGDNISFLLIDIIEKELVVENKRFLSIFGIAGYPEPASIIQIDFVDENLKANPHVKYFVPYLHKQTNS